MTQRWATFDCYGTLIDWERGITDTLGRLWPDADTVSLQERYHEIEPQVQGGSAATYRDVLAEVLRLLADAEGLSVPSGEHDAMSRSLPDWPPFPEVPAELVLIRERGWSIAILSNTDPDLLDASIAQIGVEIDLRITAAEAHSYKPAPGHWERFFSETGADPALHVHVGASIFHDIEPAAAMGMRAIWINRLAEASAASRAGELPDLRHLSDALDRLVPLP